MKQNSALIIFAVTALTACGGGSGGNDAPAFEQATYLITTNEDQATTLSVLATDKNKKDSISYGLTNASANSAIDVNSLTGEVSYQPNHNFNGSDSFEVSASDGEETVKVTVNVTVEPVNDLPMLTSTEVLVSGGETKKGSLEATDVDGDTLSYAVTATTQNGELSIDATTGEVTYQPLNLVDVNDSFTLVVTDGNGGELTKELTIKASLASNADRAYYYYASEKSHLKQAEQYITTLSNDINQGMVFANLATGYAEAGLISQVERLVTDEKIVRNEIRARTLLAVANKYNALNMLDKADEYRTQANMLYTQYVASKGISSFSSDDAEFFTGLSLSYENVGEFVKAQQALSILDLLFATALDDNSTTSALRTFFAFRNLVDDAVEKWQSTQLQADYDLAHSMVDRLYSYAKLISHRYVSNDRNGNEGKPYYSTRQVGLFDVIGSYMELNDFDNAKEALHDVLALHGVVGIDDNYPRTVDEYAEVSRIEYQYGLYGVIEEFVVLYPDENLDKFLTGFPEDSFWPALAEDDAKEALLMARVRNMADKDAAFELVKTAKNPEKLRDHFINLVAFSSKNPGGAIFLRKQGEYEAAAKFLAEGLAVLKADEYITQVSSFEVFVTGQTGCEMVIDELLTIYQLTREEKYQTQAQTTVNTCLDIVKTHYGDGVDGSDVEISDAVKANSRYFIFADNLDISEHMTSLLANVESNIAKINTDDNQELYTRLSGVGVALAYGGMFSDAQKYYDRAIVQLNLLEDKQVQEEQGDKTAKFFSYSRSTSDYSDYLNVIERHAGTLADYSQIKAKAYSAWADVIESRLTVLSNEGDQQKLTYLPAYVQQYIRLGKFEQALALATDEALGVVEKEAIITAAAMSLSVKDAFKQTLVATVDTDGDGKANFYLQTASEVAIANSGIALDEDSDNDGVNDDTDSYPLDATKQ